MRHITLGFIRKHLQEQKALLKPDRRPEPFPGKKWPTRVAWQIITYELVQDAGKSGHKWQNKQVLSYIGKPSRYRALEARKLLTAAMQAGQRRITHIWQAEFDRAGLTALCQHGYSTGKHAENLASGAFFAYHPHSTGPEVINCFIKPSWLKYVGGMRFYSQKRKLKVDELDFYYDWYHKQFRRKLRRPKAVASATIAGAVVDPISLEPVKAEDAAESE